MGTLAAHLRGLTGRRFPIVPLPQWVLIRSGKAIDAGRDRFPIASFLADSPISEEAMELICGWSGTDDSTLHELGVTPRPLDETLAVSIEAWKRAGLIRSSTRSLAVPPSLMSAPAFRRIAPKVVPRVHRTMWKLSGGRTMFDSAAQPMLMLGTTGAKSGLARQTPLAAVPAGVGRFYVVGSNFAQQSHPAWTTNLRANPDCTVTYRGRTTPMRARQISGEALDQLWPELLRWYPNWADYTNITDRNFRVFELSASASDSSNEPLARQGEMNE
jgi:deazaflavin-dependent oxidoreductase (nitroreductase family)